MKVNLCDLGLGNGFLDKTPKAKATQEQIRWTTSKLKTFMLQIISSRKWNEGQTKELKKICTSHVSQKGPIPQMNKELLQLNNKMTKNLI